MLETSEPSYTSASTSASALFVLVKAISQVSGINPDLFDYRYSCPYRKMAIAQVKPDSNWLELSLLDDGWWLLCSDGLIGCPGEPDGISVGNSKIPDERVLYSAIDSFSKEGYYLW